MKRLLLVVLGGMLLLIPKPLRAQSSSSWTGAAGTTYMSNPINWLPNGLAIGVNAGAYFGSATYRKAYADQTGIVLHYLDFASTANGDYEMRLNPITLASGATYSAVVSNSNFKVTIHNDLILSGPNFRNTGSGLGLTTLNGRISGVAALTKMGSNHLALRADNTYSGGTTISAGTIFFNNAYGSASGTGPVTVAQGAMLSGLGYLVPDTGLAITNTITINGNLEPAGTTGATDTLTMGSATTWASVSLPNANWYVNVAGDNNSKLVVNGTLDLAHASLLFSGILTGESYTLATATGGITGSLANVFNMPAQYQLVINANEIVATRQTLPVPEPSAILPLGMLGMLAFAVVRFRI